LVTKKVWFVLNFLAYSPKLVGLIEELDELELNTILFILVGDFNIDLKCVVGAQSLDFMQQTFNLQLNTDPSISTTRNGTCIDSLVTLSIYKLETTFHIFHIINLY